MNTDDIESRFIDRTWLLIHPYLTLFSWTARNMTENAIKNALQANKTSLSSELTYVHRNWDQSSMQMMMKQVD